MRILEDLAKKSIYLSAFYFFECCYAVAEKFAKYCLSSGILGKLKSSSMYFYFMQMNYQNLWPEVSILR